MPENVWDYPRPPALEPVGRTIRVELGGWVARYAAGRDHVAFYPSRLECFVDGERFRAQPGGFYGGWVTDDVAGPFKGAAGTEGW